MSNEANAPTETRTYPSIEMTREDYGIAVSFDGQCVGVAIDDGSELVCDDDLNVAIAAAVEDSSLVCDERMLREVLADLAAELD